MNFAMEIIFFYKQKNSPILQESLHQRFFLWISYRRFDSVNFN